MNVAALYVQTGGCYYGLPDVDPWGGESADLFRENRDARLYAGPHPVVAHPPCARWGRYWFGGPNWVARGYPRKALGDDGGCFAAALRAVVAYGGVLEHPAYSHAWSFFGVTVPRRFEGWVRDRAHGGSTGYVEQGAYGHRMRKGTWLYAVGAELPALPTAPAEGVFLRTDAGFHTTEERHKARAAGFRPDKRISDWERAATPIPFRDLLLEMARSVA